MTAGLPHRCILCHYHGGGPWQWWSVPKSRKLLKKQYSGPFYSGPFYQDITYVVPYQDNTTSERSAIAVSAGSSRACRRTAPQTHMSFAGEELTLTHSTRQHRSCTHPRVPVARRLVHRHVSHVLFIYFCFLHVRVSHFAVGWHAHGAPITITPSRSQDGPVDVAVIRRCRVRYLD